MKYVVVFEKAPNNWCAFVPDLPGCVSVGDTFEETKQMIREAIEFHIEAYVEDDEALPARTCVDAAVVDVHVPENARFEEPDYLLWDGDDSEIAVPDAVADVAD